MNLETLDDVAVFETLRSALEQGSHRLRIGAVAYYWGRLSTFARPSSAGAEQEIDIPLNLLDGVMGPVEIKLAVASEVGRPSN